MYDLNNRFPNDLNDATQWKLFIGVDANKVVFGTVCIQHFTENDLIYSKNGEIRLRKGSVPTVINRLKGLKVTEPTESTERTEYLEHSITSVVKNAKTVEIETATIDALDHFSSSSISDRLDQMISNDPVEPECWISLNKCKCCKDCKIAMAEKDSLIDSLRQELAQEKMQHQIYKNKFHEITDKMNELKATNKSLRDHSFYLENTKTKLKNALDELQKREDSTKLSKVLEVCISVK